MSIALERENDLLISNLIQAENCMTDSDSILSFYKADCKDNSCFPAYSLVSEKMERISSL